MSLFRFPAPLIALAVAWRSLWDAFVVGSGSVTDALGLFLLAVVVIGSGFAALRSLVEHYRRAALLTTVRQEAGVRRRRHDS